MADFLLELFSEEIPARMQRAAADSLVASFSKALEDARLKPETLRSFVTPRRVAVMATGMQATQPDISVEKKGPKVGAPQAAIDGFLKTTGLTIDQLEKRQVGKDEVYFAVIHQKGQPAADALKPITETILKSFSWPKSMRWGSHEFSWVRPLHNILCIFDGKAVPVEFGHLKANNQTFGHRFLSPQAITIAAASEYEIKLEKAHVIACNERRKGIIASEAHKLAATKNLTVKQDAGLLEEVTGLVEWPILLMGEIDARYMDLPPEVLVSEMRAHQKYFALYSGDGFAAQFLITSNMITKDAGKSVISGNERVLRARLADGRFFWDQDRKKKLDEWAKGLEGVTFHAKIGTLAEKVERIIALAAKIADAIKADKKLVERAAKLCKADLTTGMVGEFPELQGVMGRYYAQHQKEDPQVADAIRDHYLPQGPDSPVPTEPTAICVALADKLDTLISMFAIGEKPTGSKDPFALRRAALGVIRIILENKLRLPVTEILNVHYLVAKQDVEKQKRKMAVAKIMPAMQEKMEKSEKVTFKVLSKSSIDHTNPTDEQNIKDIFVFLLDRLQVMLRDKGQRHDIVAAVIGEDDDLTRLVARIKALEQFITNPSGENLLAAYKRAANILRIEEEKDKVFYRDEIDTKLLKDAPEKDLAALLETAAKNAKTGMAKEDSVYAMAELAKLRGAIDTFFDKTLVNDADPKIRKNRLHILAKIVAAMDTVANFALIEGGTAQKKAA